jgi:hypothetical protein
MAYVAYAAQVSPHSGPVAVTLTVGGTTATTVPPPTTLPPASPGSSTPAPPHQPLPLTGAPVLAGVDLALLLTVAGALFVTLANRLVGRVVPRPGR